MVPGIGTPDSAPMVSGTIHWNPRLRIDASSSPDPADIAGAVDAAGKVYVFWVTSESGGSLKSASLVNPYTSASSVATFSALGSNPRYPHVPSQVPLSRGYIPLLYQYGSGPYNIVL